MKKTFKYFFILHILFFYYSDAYPQEKKDSLITAIQSSKTDTIKIRLLIQLGFEETNSNPINAEQHINEACNLSKKINYLKGTALGYIAMGELSIKQGNYLKAYEQSLNALQLFEKLKDKKEMAHCLNQLAVIFYFQGNLNKALEFYFAALNLSREVKNLKMEAICLNNIGIIFHSQNQPAKAISYYRMALKIFNTVHLLNGVAECYNYIGWTYLAEKKYDTALAYFFKAINIFEKQNDKLNKSRNLGSISEVYLQINKNELALSYALQSLKIKKELGYKYDIASALTGIAQIHTKLKNFKKAIESGGEAYQTFLEINNKDGMRESSLALSSAYEGKNDIALAFKYYKASMAMKDSLFGVEKTDLVNKIESKFALKEKENEIKLLQKDRKLSDAYIEKKKLQYALLVSGTVFLSLIIIILSLGFYKARSVNNILKSQAIKIREANTLLESKNDELQQKGDELKIKSDELEIKNDLLEKKNEELYVLNNFLDERVKEKTKQYLDLSQRLIQYHYANSQKLKHSLHDILTFIKMCVKLPDETKIITIRQDIIKYIIGSANNIDNMIIDIFETLRSTGDLGKAEE